MHGGGFGVVGRVSSTIKRGLVKNDWIKNKDTQKSDCTAAVLA